MNALILIETKIESKVIEMKSLEFMRCVLPLILKMLVILNNNI
jgi:hypothetical protein